MEDNLRLKAQFGPYEDGFTGTQPQMHKRTIHFQFPSFPISHAFQATQTETGQILLFSPAEQNLLPS